ncbi:MAG: hypothetical protein P2A85_29020 (plasmid) [Microcoleus anatoxicus]|uniref:hypothetical protein n=1 Tax=Microcoleus anatoxicus TaxID=2705319 RepID=UPI00366FBFD3
MLLEAKLHWWRGCVEGDRVQQQINQAICPEHFTSEEWAQQQQLVNEAITLMQSYLDNPSYESRN